MNSLDAFIESVPIEMVVARYRPLVKSGKHFKALCPFHDDHKPSLIVNTEQNFAWCFACQNGGNPVSFLQRIEGFSFPEAVKTAGEIAGIDTTGLLKIDSSPQSKEKKEYSERIREVLEASFQFFRDQYKNHLPAQEYIQKRRGLSKQIEQVFGIGYAPEGFHTLEKFLLSKKFSRKEMIDAGMLSYGKSESETYDRFRGRVIFPLHDSLGKVIGFCGRILGEGNVKYLNSPDSLLYDKSKQLYGFSLAKKEIRSNDRVIMVEGNMDVVACHQWGICNAVALSGVGFSEDQARLVKRFTKNVVLALDNDSAGQSALERIIPLMLKNDLNIFVANVPGGKDPDEALKEDFEAVRKCFETAPPAFHFLLRMWIEKSDQSTTGWQKGVLEKGFEIIEYMPTRLEQSESLHYIAEQLSIDRVLLDDEWRRFGHSKKHGGMSSKKKSDSMKSSKMSPKWYFFGIILGFFEESEIVFKTITPDFFSEKEEKELYSLLFHAYNERRTLHFKEIIKTFSLEFQEQVDKALTFAGVNLSHISVPQRQSEIKNIAFSIGKTLLSQEVSVLQKEISQSPSPESLKRFQSLISLLQKFHLSF